MRIQAARFERVQALLVTLAFGLSAAFATGAGAEPTTIHELTVRIDAISQGRRGSGDLRENRTRIGNRDLAELCLGRRLDRMERLALLIDCDGFATDVAFIDTEPLRIIEVIGTVSFGTAVFDRRGRRIRSARLVGDVELECGEGALDLDAIGVFDVSFKDLGGESCPDSADAEIVGSAFIDDGASEGIDAIVNQGSRLKAAKRLGGISIPLGLEE